jgi:hypothetical protein
MTNEVPTEVSRSGLPSGEWLDRPVSPARTVT